MLVGAVARHALHVAHGHTYPLRRTDDLDLALAVRGWDAFETLTSRLRPVRSSTSTIRYEIAGHRVDLVPFGKLVEQPDGVVTPVRRGEAMSVFGFQDVYAAAHEIVLAGGLRARVPTVPGYAALKLKAWADRSAAHEYKDAADLAVAMHWYQDDPAVDARVWSGARRVSSASSDQTSPRRKRPCDC